MSDSPRQRAKQNVCSLIELNRHYTDTEHAAAKARTVSSVGIVGAGVMGASIAAATVKHELPVVITDASQDVLADLPAKVAAELLDEGNPSGTQTRAALHRLVQPTVDSAAIARCDLVLETVVEKAAVKQQVLADLEPGLGKGTILTTNTSTISIARLAGGLADPSRFCGIHFFHPVRERPVVEIIRGPQSSEQTLATAVAYAKAIGKMPLVVHDGPGFLVNRLMLLYVSEAMQLLLEGAQIDAVERAGTDFGMALGPLTLLDETGLDTALNCGWVFSGAYPDTVATSPLLVAMVKAGRLGRKSAAGFFSYADADRKTTTNADRKTTTKRSDPAAEEIIARWAKPAGRHTSAAITARLFLPMLLEATRILSEKKTRDPRLIDLGVIFGLGFPESRGGLLFWADTLGAARIVEMLRPLESLGPRARPTPMLLEMAAENRRFYESG